MYTDARSGWQVGTLVGAQVLHHGGGSTRRTSDRMRPALFRSKIRYLSLHRGEQSARLFAYRSHRRGFACHPCAISGVGE